MGNKYITMSFDYLHGLPSAFGGIFGNHVSAQLRIRNKERLFSGASQTNMFKAKMDKKNELATSKTETLKKIANLREEAKSKKEIAVRYLDRALGMSISSSDSSVNPLIETR